MLDSGTRLGPYEILAPLGAGGMGEVYRARDTRLDRLVAVKVLPSAANSQAVERFEREAKAIAALNHPGICALYDVGMSPVPYLVMELLDGETLHQRLARGAVDTPTLIHTGIAVADALASAHGRGIVHRDLKPANIFLTDRGPKILDFGLARLTESAAPPGAGATTVITQAQAPLTDVGVAVGTVAYMSPEQLRGEPVDARTDLFSLGVVLYEMATGRRAFPGATTAVISAAILHEQPPRPRELRPDLPPRLEQAILTLFEKNRDIRTQTASELRAELTRVTRELGDVRTASGAPGASSHSSVKAANPESVAAAHPGSSDTQIIAGVIGRHRGALLAAAAIVLALISGAAYLVMSRPATGSGSQDTAHLSVSDLTVDTLTSSGSADSPALAPDGSYVVYVEHGEAGDSLRVRQKTIQNAHVIVPAEPGVFLRGPTVTPDGQFVNYLRQVGSQRNELWQVPYLGGVPPRRLLQGVGNGGVRYSPDGKRMTYVRPAAVGSELMVAASDGSDARVLAARQPPLIFWPFGVAWSPDQRTIAVLGGRIGEKPTGQLVFVDASSGVVRGSVDFGSPLIGTGLAWLNDTQLIGSFADRSSAPLQLWLVSYPEGVFRRLTNDTSQYVSLSVTADRNELVTSRNEAYFSIWTSDASAKAFQQEVPITPTKGQIGFRLAWLDDDLLYSASATGGFALTRWRSSTRTTEILAQSGGNVSVSGDTQSIVFFDYDGSQLWKTDAAGTNRLRVRGNGSFGGGKLTPDGADIVTLEQPNPSAGLPARITRTSADSAGTQRIITTMNVRAGTTGTTETAPLATGVEVSPNGRRIAYPSFDDRKQPALAVCDYPACPAASTVVLPVVGTWHWTPDSQAIAYVDPRTQSDLWIQPLDKRPAQPLTRFAPDGLQIWDFAWRFDGQRLAVARANVANNIVLFRGLGSRK